MIVGCYTLELYCDCENPAHEYKEFPHRYTAETGAECRANARRDGWVLDRKNARERCPKCRRKPWPERLSRAGG